MEGIHRSKKSLFPFAVILVISVILSHPTDARVIDRNSITERSNVPISVTSPIISTNGEAAGDKMAAEITNVGNKGKSLDGLKAKKTQLAIRIKRSEYSGSTTRGGSVAKEPWDNGAPEETLSSLDPESEALFPAGDAGKPLYGPGWFRPLGGSAFERQWFYPAGGAASKGPRALGVDASKGLNQSGGAASDGLRVQSGDTSKGTHSAWSGAFEHLQSIDGATSEGLNPTGSTAESMDSDDRLMVPSFRKRNRIAEGFLGMRGKKAFRSLPPGGVEGEFLQPQKYPLDGTLASWLRLYHASKDAQDAWPMITRGHPLPPKRNRVFEGFLGMRGKKGGGNIPSNTKFASGFLGMRGKKDQRTPSLGSFYGMRGKKDDDDIQMYDTLDDVDWKESQQDGEVHSGQKRIPEGFLGMRGKRRAGDDDGSPERQPEMFAAMRRLSGYGYRGPRMRDGGAIFPNFSFARGLAARSKALANDRKRQIGSIFVGMRG